jgi:hypothetical protein
MSIVYDDNEAKLSGFINIEETDQLLAWACAYPKGELNLGDCEHIHTAGLQVLMAAATLKVICWPSDEKLASWLEGALKQSDRGLMK